MGEDPRWWEGDQGDRTDEVLARYSSGVQEQLLEQGRIGYQLGDAKVYSWTALQICILDPQNDIPGDILLFANNISAFINGERPQTINSEDLHYKYDPVKDRYDIEFVLPGDNTPQKAFRGSFYKNARIFGMEEEQL